MHDAGPEIAAAGIAAIDHPVEPLGGDPGRLRPVLGDQVGRDALDFRIGGVHFLSFPGGIVTNLTSR